MRGVHRLVFGFGLAVVLGGCGGDAAETTLDPLNRQASDAGSEAATAEPFQGPCDATGTWKLTYEVIEEDECGLPSIEDVIEVAPGETPPVSLGNEITLAEMKSASIENDGCTIKAQWGWQDWLGDPGGEMEGANDTLELTLTSPTTADGMVIHSQLWWCGYSTIRTFLAHAQRQ
jgi:hypothetical protein